MLRGTAGNYFVPGYICKNCQKKRPTHVQIFTGAKALQSAFGHIGGSRDCRLAKLGLQEIRVPFGTRDAAVGGSGAAEPAGAQARLRRQYSSSLPLSDEG